MKGLRAGALTLAVVAFSLTFAASANAASTDFYSSFEAGDPAPTWTNEPERAEGVRGPDRSGIPGNITDTVVAVAASDENTSGGEVKENAVDGSPDSKWLTFHPTGWLSVELAEPVAVTTYALTSANDAPERDPRDWTLQGSDDGSSWTTIDTKTGQSFSERFQTKQYEIDPAKVAGYRFYKLDITANGSGNIIQLAELQLSNGVTSPPPAEMRSQLGSGPRGGYNAKSAVGWTGLRALQYAGKQTSEDRGYSYNRVFDVDVDVKPATELSYVIYPQFMKDDLSYPSTYAAVDLAFTDGTYLSDLGASDQHGATVSPQGQGRSKTLYTNQWNFIRSRIGGVAAGKTIDRILVGYDNPDGPADFAGWLDDIKIAGSPASRDHARPSDWVPTNRGTNSSGSFSRGNNIPATAMPHGFNFWTPMTNAGSISWLYEYQKANNADNLPTLQAFAASHEPSPWMGDRQTFQVMPSVADGTPDARRAARALPFRHDNEVARPYYYGVTFENGLETEIAPTDHAALFRFSFPGATSSLIFDNVNNSAGLTIDAGSGVVQGWSDVRSGLSNGATRMFMYATFDKPIKASGMLPTGNRPSTGYVRFDARTVNMRIATSLISVAQAKHNLELELAAGDTLESVRDRAQDAWDKKLSVVEVEGATEDQRTTLYSSLYRLFLYPNSAFENTGTASKPRFRHALQSTTSSTPPASTPTETGAPIMNGKLYVNNGFWDTYRTTWSAYGLFSPGMAGELVDGFVQQYRDGGWIARWSSPGYANLMTGTSSDVAFADAYVKGVQGFDGLDAYNAALKNATVAPPGDPFDPNVGRKGLVNSLFLGYTPDRVGEGVSWALEGDINDYGISNMAAKLATQAGGAGRQQRFAEEAEYFRSRATDYVNMFDPSIRFFQGRDEQGRWKSPPSEYDPREWGHDHDYTETDGWNFAFHAPQDGQGLANLYGGRDKLEQKLDTFFSTPETATFVGSYGGVIHEMTEARDVRMGQWGFSNQVSHHIPYMYDYASAPAKTQAKVREALRRLYLGSEIGQGYAGDEDNGETSAWFLFSALGFYPLQVGSEYYAIGSPLFKKATVKLPGGNLVVSAPGNSQDNVYVQGLKLNGKPYDKAYLRHSDIAKGGTLEFDMGPEPSDWGTGHDAAPPSITTGDEPAAPLRDQTGGERSTASAKGDVTALSDDDSRTVASVNGAVEFTLTAGPRDVAFYTLTSAPGTGSDPSSWVVQGSNDGQSWSTLDERTDQTFTWRSQTRPFKLRAPGKFSRYRIAFAGSPVALGEVELLAHEQADMSPVSATVASTAGVDGQTLPVEVDVSNFAESTATGSVTATAPSGWTVTPATQQFGPIEPAESGTLTFQVGVPAGTAPGTYTVRFAGTSDAGDFRATGTVTVIGDRIEFAAGSAEEEPWLFDADGSQFDGEGRYSDNGTHYTYRFALPADATGGTLSLEMANEFKVLASTDNSTWTTVATETRPITDRSNQDVYTFDLNALRGGSSAQTLYLRFEDSKPDDGWGAWLTHLTLDLQRP